MFGSSKEEMNFPRLVLLFVLTSLLVAQRMRWRTQDAQNHNKKEGRGFCFTFLFLFFLWPDGCSKKTKKLSYFLLSVTISSNLSISADYQIGLRISFIDFWLADMALYLLQSLTFTFPPAVLIYLKESLIYKHKSAGLSVQCVPGRISAVASNFTGAGGSDDGHNLRPS